jgi:CheY-like chemotaxis protein
VVTSLAEVPSVAGNAAELREILTNLIFNAVDAMPSGGTITVSTAEHERGAAVSVQDTGFGMTEQERERCLEPFFTTKGEHGTGLGLSVVYGIVQRHGGTIQIASEKGVGTTFTIALPGTALAVAEAPETSEKVDRTLCILVVDDQEIICELIAEYLKSDGHETMMAPNGRAALEIFQRAHFDLVITDQSMPEMNGVHLGQAIHQEPNAAPVILLTGFGEEMQAMEDRPKGIDLVVSKPVSNADLRRAIHQVMTTAALGAGA